MLFNSYIFIFAFLPFTFLGYFFLAKHKSGETAISFLVLASLFFYGWWNPIYLLLILVSMAVNYGLGETIVRRRNSQKFKQAQGFLIYGLIFNLGLLAYFKYANFIVDNINSLFSSGFNLDEIILPLAISFFTFQQIAYLIDAYRGITKEFKFSHYALFVTFFPQLIAGPIVHHKEMLPQFMQMDNLKPKLENMIIGLTIFSLGLFKKVVIADGVAQYSTPVFDAAAAGEALSFFIAWGGALAYSFQLYFDFSGYSDMAIGIAKMFGILLPLNFASPYKSLSIIEFWRRWHMTLSRFLRDYVYISLGGNRKGDVRRFANLFATMLLGGLWHGAGWTFVFWGGLHGLYLVINHGWHYLQRKAKLEFLHQNLLWRVFSWFLTFFAIVNAWVFFRASSFTAAVVMMEGMYGFNGVAIPNAIFARLGGLQTILNQIGVTSFIGGGSQFMFTYLWVSALLVAVLLPNTQQIMNSHPDAQLRSPYALCDQGLLSGKLKFRYGVCWAMVSACALVIAVFGLTRVSEFLYFQF